LAFRRLEHGAGRHFNRQPGTIEFIGKFSGADQLRNAVNQLQSLLYAA
jgi:hypothetical protein